MAEKFLTRLFLFSTMPNKWILGLYNPVPTICSTDSVPPAPVPVFHITMFGSSIF